MLYRLRSLSQLEPLIPLCTHYNEKMRVLFNETLVLFIERNPGSILVLASYDDNDDTKEVNAFLIAMDPGVKVPYISIAQLWGRLGNDPDWYKPFLMHLVLWGLSLDKDFIRGETRLSVRAMCRRFGLTPGVATVEYNLKELQQQSLHNSEEFLICLSDQIYHRKPSP